MAGIIFTVGLFTKTILSYLLSSLTLVSLVVTVIIKMCKAKELKMFKVLSIIVAFLISSLTTFGYVYSYQNKTEYEGEYIVTGYLAETVTYSANDNVVITLENCTIVSVEDDKVYNPNGFIKFYLNAGSGHSFNADLGTKLEIYASLSKPDIVGDGKFNAYAINKNISAYGFGYEDDVTILKGNNLNIFDKIKIKTKQTLDTYLSKDYSSLAYTMLFGDKSGLDQDISLNYSASGIGHLLAVSGLHVGFVVTILSLILKLFLIISKHFSSFTSKSTFKQSSFSPLLIAKIL